MRKNRIKIVSIFLIVCAVFLIGVNVYAHSGRTDSSGGHKDNKNKSGLGNYHYHCGGYPAHLHTNGLCPYAASSSSTEGSISNTEITATELPNVAVTGIYINEKIESLEVGQSKILTATIEPGDATDKNIIWKSSDESIATVSTTGEVVAKRYGTVDIMATSSNGKTCTIKINVKESPKTENKISIISKNDITNDTTNNREELNPLVGILTLGLIAGGGYFVYKKYKKSNM